MRLRQADVVDAALRAAWSTSRTAPSAHVGVPFTEEARSARGARSGFLSSIRSSGTSSPEDTIAIVAM